jgi:hypothetical protein
LYKVGDPAVPLPGTGAHTITIGEVVYDTASVTGHNPTGTVQFQVKVPGGTWADFGPAEILTGGAAQSINYTATVTGTHYFRAIYSGDANNNGSQSGDMEEPLIVAKKDTTTTTLLYKVGDPAVPLPGTGAHTITIGEVVYDTASVTGYAPVTGTVQFQVKVPGDTWADFGPTQTLTGGAAQSINYTATVTGTHYFRAIYSGDANNNGSQSGDMEEPLIVDPATTTTTTKLYAVGDPNVDLSVGVIPGTPSTYHVLSLGAVLFDTVTVTSANGTPTGTVWFQVKTPTTDWANFGSEETLVGGVATSDQYTPTMAGTYYFRAIYTPDSTNWTGSQSGLEEEPVIIEDIPQMFDTAWAAHEIGVYRYLVRGNWATFIDFEEADGQVNIYAGQSKLVGTASFVNNGDGTVTISITLIDGWAFDASKVNLMVQGYEDAPYGVQPIPGQFAYSSTETGTTASIIVPLANFYGIHLNVCK